VDDGLARRQRPLPHQTLRPRRQGQQDRGPKLKFKAWKLTVYPKLKAKQAAPAPRYTVEQLCKDYFAEVKKRYVGPDGKHTASVNRHKSCSNRSPGCTGRRSPTT
jgi:hypothetical protein